MIIWKKRLYDLCDVRKYYIRSTFILGTVSNLFSSAFKFVVAIPFHLILPKTKVHYSKQNHTFLINITDAFALLITIIIFRGMARTREIM